MLALVAGLLWSPATSFADLPVPQGRFFTEALPNGNGFGFTVVDGHGARLWSAYQARGGVQGLGYPISRRFEWDGAPAQAFERGILRWDPARDDAEVRQVSALPGRKLPTYAVEPDRPPLVQAETERPAWSGWWWPAFEGLGPTLFAPNSPLDKYDRYVAAVTGQSPGTRAWERQQLYFPSDRWAGHCNGFAAAALLEPEPTEPVEVLGITFSVGDQKGLLADYHFGDAAAWSFGQDDEVSPADFHRILLNWFAVTRKGFVLTFDMGGGEVWSYPVYRFETEWAPDPVEPDLWLVRTRVWMADMNVPANFIGTKPYPGPEGKLFEYNLRGDPRKASEGAWTGSSQRGRFAHPGRIWYPEPSVRNDERELVSPALDRQTLANILKGSDGTEVANSPPP